MTELEKKFVKAPWNAEAETRLTTVEAKVTQAEADIVDLDARVTVLEP